jgi:hypothetical protein
MIIVRGESGMDNPSPRIRILRIWSSVFNIRADADNPNPIIYGCGVGYVIGENRRIWIIRLLSADYPMLIIG